MGQVASLIRVERTAFEKVERTKKYPKTFAEEISVDKLWEPIMYVLGKGHLGRLPITNLFMPRKIIVTYQDEYMTEGIRYHDASDIAELFNAMENHSIEDLIAKVDVESMNSKIMYPIMESDLEEIKQHIIQIRASLQKAIENDQIIIASIN